jgi:hypothetical protein
MQNILLKIFFMKILKNSIIYNLSLNIYQSILDNYSNGYYKGSERKKIIPTIWKESISNSWFSFSSPEIFINK